MVRITKAECENALTHITKRNHRMSEGQEIIKELIHIHFDRIPLQYEDLKIDQWVWYSPNKICCQVHSKRNHGKKKEVVLKVPQPNGAFASWQVEYEKNHFFLVREYS